MPTAGENAILYSLEDRFSVLLGAHDNAIFLARVTCQGVREISYRIRDPESANDVMQALIAESPPIREWEFRLEKDKAWVLAFADLSSLDIGVSQAAPADSCS